MPDDAGLVGAVVAKLRSAPIEDLRLDAEDGYGDHPDRESADVIEAATTLAAEVVDGTAPARVGIRFKCLESPTRRRGLESLELFLSTLLREAGSLPSGLRLTCPKVTSVEQVAVMASVLEQLEVGLGLSARTLTFEVQAETPQVILGADGTITAARMLEAGEGRISGVHYGTYDYSAALGVDGAYQASDHPVADQAKDLLQLALAGTPVELSDGSTNLVPEGPGAVHAWSEHARLVTRHLRRGIRQGWDLHPAHLVTRYLATYAHYRNGYEATASRLAAYLGGVEGDVMDEPATARALAAFLVRGLACGALSAAEIGSAAPELDLAAVTALAR
jgi:citrate lyase beta subunit